MSNYRSHLGWLVILVAAAIQVPRVLANRHPDLFIYRAGATLGLAGRSPYDIAAISERVAGQYPDDPDLVANCGFFLAPQAVVVFAPLAALPWPVAKAVWSLGLVAAAGLALWRLTAFTASEPCRRFVLLAAGALLLNPFTDDGLIVGQTPLLIFACVVLGEAAHRSGRRRLAGLLWAVPFVKPHLALPLVPLAWYLGGWRRAAELVAWVAGLNLLGCAVVSGSPALFADYLAHLAASHKAVTYNRVELNPQVTGWNRLLIGLGGPVVEQTAATTLAGYAVWGLLVAARVRLAAARPTPALALAAAAVGALVCCQALPHELPLLGLVAPLLLDLAAGGRTRAAVALVAVLGLVSVPFDAVMWFIDSAELPPRAAELVMSHRSVGVAALAVAILAVGWRPATSATPSSPSAPSR